jgi:hypothetical protein
MSSPFSDAETIVNRIVEKLSSAHGHKYVLAHMALLITCLQALGKLSERFPSIAVTTVVPALRDFLLTPSPILVKLAQAYKDVVTESGGGTGAASSGAAIAGSEDGGDSNSVRHLMFINKLFCAEHARFALQQCRHFNGCD